MLIHLVLSSYYVHISISWHLFNLPYQIKDVCMYAYMHALSDSKLDFYDFFS